MTDNFGLVVNGRRHDVNVDGETPLLYILRNDLGLKGTRLGCGEGLCGACTILLDTEDAHSCQLAVWQAVGREVVTVEGLVGSRGELGRVQRALVSRSAAQCGYCLSGIVIRIEAGLRQGLSRADIVEKLQGNLCRCGAHGRILQALDDLLAEQGTNR